MTYNPLQHGEHTLLRDVNFSYFWIPHVQSLSFHAYSLFSGLKNDKCASGESTQSGRTVIGWIDLPAKRPNTDRRGSPASDHKLQLLTCLWNASYSILPSSYSFSRSMPHILSQNVPILDHVACSDMFADFRNWWNPSTPTRQADRHSNNQANRI